MAEKGGKDLLLKYGGTTLGGLRATEYTITNEEIEVTNHGSNQYKEVLDGAGIRSMTVSGSGIHDGDAATLDAVEDLCIAGTLGTFTVVDPDRTYSASFKVTEFGRSGEYNGAQEYSISLQSSGTVTIS
jgi:predicted secreted protein